MRAVGGNITYTDLDGLNPSLTPYENGYVIHTFLSSEDLIVSEGGDVEYLIVAGGGAGGAYGGGGGGGVRTGNANIESGIFPVVIGDGGTPTFSYFGLASIGNGEDSSFNGIVSVGGGGGGNNDKSTEADAIGADGGSGGGGGANDDDDFEINYGGSGIPGQGNDGGNTLGQYGSPCGGGGGAGEAGYDSYTRKGGDGIESLISGESKYYGGGGGGGVHNVSVGVYGDGGLGGGGRGSWAVGAGGSTSTSGEENTGGGGGGGYGVYVYDPTNPKPGTYGGSGIIILKYLYSSTPEVDVSTLPASNITQSNFVANGRIDSIGEGITIVKRGFCYKVKE